MTKPSKKLPPAAENRLVEVDPETRMMRWYRIEPVVIGELQYKDVTTWVSDEGETYHSATDALVRFLERWKSKPRELAPATYTVNASDLRRDGGRVVIPTPTGDVVILLNG
jgi:hypothetical protein